MNELATRSGELVERANKVSRMKEAELRRFATEAANARDLERLWEIVEAYVVTKGRKKGAVSPGTLESYRHGIERLLFHWQGENLLRPSRDAGERYVLELQAGGQEWPVKPRANRKKAQKTTRTLPPDGRAPSPADLHRPVTGCPGPGAGLSPRHRASVTGGAGRGLSPAAA